METEEITNLRAEIESIEKEELINPDRFFWLAIAGLRALLIIAKALVNIDRNHR
jgi:hypothetical protein